MCILSLWDSNGFPSRERGMKTLAHRSIGGAFRQRVLIVEDDYHIAETLRNEFERLGFGVIGMVATQEDAFSLLDRVNPTDGVVLDINLRGQHAYRLADALLKRRIRFVFCTGYDREALPSAYRTVPLCLKPVGAEEVARTLLSP